jgi:hypothetical protein
MAAFETLLNRLCTRKRIVDTSLELEAFAGRADDAPVERAWRSWAAAYAALHQGDPRLALTWLAAGRRLVDAADDPILGAEYESATANCWAALDEPKAVAGPARYAWHLWSSFASKPSKELVVRSACVLLKVLSEPHPPPRLRGDDVFTAWLMDRFERGFIDAAQLVMQVYADHRQIELATEVANTFLAWLERHLMSQESAKALSGLPAARILRALGDVHDRCGDAASALSVFHDALQRVEGLPDNREIAALRGSLQFNSANQLAKLGRQKDALKEFKAANAILKKLGDREAVLRGRYAVCISRFKLGDCDGIEDELAQLAAEYEQVLAEARTGPQVLASRQGLDRVYRLWLRLLAQRFDSRDARATLWFLHHVFALKEEEGKLADLRRKLEQCKGRAFLSEITIMLDRAGRRHDLAILVIEQVVDAVLVVSVAPGEEPWNQRIAVQTIIDCASVASIVALIQCHRDVMDQLCNYSMPTRSTPDESFVAACKAVWGVLNETVRAHIAAAQTLMVCLDSQTDLDRFPVELLHDGSDYIGLSKDVLRAPSLRDLNLLLGDNRTNGARTGTAIVLRADDDLPKADAEVGIVKDGLRQLKIEPRVLRAPSVAMLLDELGTGVDVLHYAGHGLADPVGEALPLGREKQLTAAQLEKLHPAPAPATVLSACLIGRSRQLRTGHEQGFATQLLRRGSPAVIAAMYVVPDALTFEVTELLYSFMSEGTLAAALRATRQALAEDKCHPGAWASFVMFGRPDVCVTAPHASKATTWPCAAMRYLATSAESDLSHAQDLLEHDVRLSEACREAIGCELAKLGCGDSDYFQPASLPSINGLQEFPEAEMAHLLIRVFGLIRYGKTKNSEEREKQIHEDIAEALLFATILGDTYVLVAAAAELCSRTFLHLGEHKNTALLARRRLSWLSSEGAKLDKARAIIGSEEA